MRRARRNKNGKLPARFRFARPTRGLVKNPVTVRLV
jgi:hypothetical protein